MITRYNYEEYFLLYVDNELSAAERKAVEDFIHHNADLADELKTLQQSVFKPESDISFENKELLLKQAEEDSLINLSNYEEYFLLYIDNELDPAAKTDVEIYILQNPSLQNELNLLQQTKTQPDAAIAFEGKEILYKKEEKRRPIPFTWISAAAVAILLVTGFLLYNNDGKKQTEHQNRTASVSGSKNQSKNNPSIEKFKKDEKVVTTAIVDSLNSKESGKKEMVIKENNKEKQALVSNYVINNRQKNKIINKKDDNLAVRISKPKEDTQSKNAKPVEIAKTNTKEKEITTGLIAPKLNVAPNKLIAKTDQLDEASKNNTETSYASQVVMTSNDVDYIDTDNTSAKKNKLRGIFRKVSRVFEKTTNVEDGNKKSVSIGSFQIALK